MVKYFMFFWLLVGEFMTIVPEPYTCETVILVSAVFQIPVSLTQVWYLRYFKQCEKFFFMHKTKHYCKCDDILPEGGTKAKIINLVSNTSAENSHSSS